MSLKTKLKNRILSLSRKNQARVLYVRSLIDGLRATDDGAYPMLPDVRIPGVASEALPSLDMLGENWFSAESLPIAVFWGFEPWKRPHMQAYFPGHKMAFVLGSGHFIRLKKMLRRLPKSDKIVFIGWGLKLPYYVERFAKKNDIAVKYVEDGFLRSFNPGALHVKPYSLAIDSHAPYYDTQNRTNLQDIIERNHTEGMSPEIENLGAVGVEIMKAACLTKYFPLHSSDDDWELPTEDGKDTILVIGQVEDDAAIQKGYKRPLFGAPYSNLKAVQKAIEDNPDAYIVYRPHPDSFYNGRLSQDEKKITNLCAIMEPSFSLQAAFPLVDKVYTGTSLAGFEAAIWGKSVTTLGCPFYAPNDGINNLQSGRLKDLHLSLEQLFAATYLQYPKYIHPDGEEECSFFDIASYFIVEKFKHRVLAGIDPETLDLAVLESRSSYLAPTVQLLIHLQKIGRTGEIPPGDLVSLAGERPRYMDFAHFSELLIKACRFDALAMYTLLISEQLDKDITPLKEQKALMTVVFQTLVKNQRTLRGRVKLEFPDISEWIAPRTFEGYIVSDDLLVAYVRAASHNLQYELIETIVENIELATYQIERLYDASLLRKLVTAVNERPSRSERDSKKRFDLSSRLGAVYEKRIMAQMDVHPLLLNAHVSIALDRIHECETACLKLILAIEKEAELEQASLKTMLNKQKGIVTGIINFLARNSSNDTAYALLDLLDSESPQVQVQKLRMLVMRNKIRDFYAHYVELPAEMKQRSVINDLLVQANLKEGNLVSAKIAIENNIRLTKISREKRAILHEQKEKIEFSQGASRILRSVPQPQFPKGVIFVGTFSDHKNIALLVPVLREAKRLGYAIISMTDGILPREQTGIPSIDQFLGAMPTRNLARKLEHTNEWVVNWENKIVSSGGVNYFQGFRESLINFFRVYDVNINTEEMRKNFLYRLTRADDALDMCNRILRDVAAKGIPSIIVSGDGHIVPYSVFRDFCRSHNHPNLSYVNVNMGYENYFTNLGGRFSSTMTLSDMTMFPEHRAPFLARTDRFEKWYEKENGNPTIAKRADELINTNRVNSDGDTAKTLLIDFLDQEKSKGRKVIASLGKLTIDMGVPYDGGPAHDDLRDWLNHTIDIVRGNEDIILLIKPHPHELVPSIALDLVDKFTDLISGPLPDNVRILGHREINNYELVPYLDLALIWNGSSAPELAARGVPVMMAGYFGRHDYPVKLLYPKNRKHFEKFILSKDWQVPDAQTRKRAAFLIAYLESDDVTIRNDYAWRTVSNDSVGVPTWRKDRVAELIKNGDLEMERAAARLVERFEPRLSQG